jgi:hypothetical protein
MRENTWDRMMHRLLSEQKEMQAKAKKSKGSKPDFLDLDKDGDKEEPISKASKETGDKKDAPKSKKEKGKIPPQLKMHLKKKKKSKLDEAIEKLEEILIEGQEEEDLLYFDNDKKKDNLRVESLNYHLQNKIPLTETVFRPGSTSHINLVADTKQLWKEGKYEPNKQEILLFKTNIGEWAEYGRKKVPLDCPMVYESTINEAEFKGKKVSLGKPARGGSKKFYVYVKCGDKVKKISFGDPGLSVKVGDPERRKSFVARHKCTQKNDRCSAGYWSCRIGRYPNLTGAKQRYTWW